MPQARSSGSGASSGGSSSGRSSSRRSSGTGSGGSRSSGAAKRTTKRSSSAGTASRSRARASSSGTGQASNGGAASSATGADPRLDAVAQRVRKLNEKIIEESKSAGEATLTAYEKALKAIASSLERGPGKSDVEWVSSLATTQAKWIRDITAAWTSAARGMLK